MNWKLALNLPNCLMLFTETETIPNTCAYVFRKISLQFVLGGRINWLEIISKILDLFVTQPTTAPQ